MVCGGKDCPKCGIEAYRKLPNPAIERLHSHWITDYIVAMQRPNNTSLEAGSLADMKKKKITAVFNLTEPGEHPFCGPGNVHSCGFPYNPELLMSQGIKHFNFSWQDMTAPTISQMMEITNIAVHEIEAGGKIAVHCHAGFGRTGITCAAVMIVHEHLTASNVINYIRKRRPGSIQTPKQEEFIRKFEAAYHQLMEIFPIYETTVHANHSLTPSSNNTSMEANSGGSGNHRKSPETVPEDPIPSDLPFQGVISPRRSSFSQETSQDPYSTPRKSGTATPNNTRRSFSRPQTPPPRNGATSPTPLEGPIHPVTASGGGINAILVLNGTTSNPPPSGSSRRRSSAVLNFSLHTKTLAQTMRDHQYILTQSDLSSGVYKYLHKLMYVISQAICLLAKDHFTIACLALTGLTKLAIKNTMNSLIDIDDRGAQRSDRIFGIIAGPLIRRRSSFMVATNALSESSEEGMLRDLKLELNHNKWAKLLSLGDIISSSLRFSTDSVSKIARVSRSLSSSYSRSRLQTMGSIKELPIEHETAEDKKEMADRLRPASINTTTINEDEMMMTPAAMALSKPLASLPPSPTSNVSSAPVSVIATPIAAAGTSKHFTAEEIKTISEPPPATTTQKEEEKKEEKESEPDQLLPPVNLLGAPLLSPTSPSTGPNPNTNTTNNPNTHRKSFMSNNPAASARKVNFRNNTLKQTSDADYAKSKKMAANLIAQLLLDFLETRKDPLFSEEIITSFIQIWKNHGDIYDVDPVLSPRGITQNIRLHNTFSADPNHETTKLVTELMNCLMEKLDRFQIELLNAIINIYVALHDVVKSSEHYEQQYTELIQSSCKIPGYQNALQTLQALQATNFESTKVNPSTTSESPMSTSTRESGSLLNDNPILNSEVLECMEALDALVGLRLAIACIHARKSNPTLIQNRSLMVDLVKLFLLKTSRAEFVVINNITFNEESYHHITNHFGIDLLYRIDVVFRTLHLLVEYHWYDLNLYREEELLGLHQHHNQLNPPDSTTKRRGSSAIQAPSPSQRMSKEAIAGLQQKNMMMWNLLDYEDYVHLHPPSKIKWDEKRALQANTTTPSSPHGMGVLSTTASARNITVTTTTTRNTTPRGGGGGNKENSSSKSNPSHESPPITNNNINNELFVATASSPIAATEEGNLLGHDLPLPTRVMVKRSSSGKASPREEGEAITEMDRKD